MAYQLPKHLPTRCTTGRIGPTRENPHRIECVGTKGKVAASALLQRFERVLSGKNNAGNAGRLQQPVPAINHFI